MLHKLGEGVGVGVRMKVNNSKSNPNFKWNLDSQTLIAFDILTTEYKLLYLLTFILELRF